MTELGTVFNGKAADSRTAMTGSTDDLQRALTFLGWDVSRDRIVEAGYVAGGVLAALGVIPAAWWFGIFPGIVVGMAVGTATVHAVHRAPIWCATLRRTRALGAAPGLVGRLVLRMRLDPSTERAVRFAARTGEGPLADDLAAYERRHVDSPTSGLDRFAREWRPWFPALDRAVTLVRTAASTPPNRRDRSLDRALDAVLSGTTDRLAAFVGDVQGPVSALYAFGVLLPLALIALLPAAAASGVPIGPAVVAVLYLIGLPIGLLAAGAWLLSRRPVAFPPPVVDADHPEVPRRGPMATAAGIVSGGVAALVSGILVEPWTIPIAGAGVGIGVALLVFARPRRRVLTQIRAVERGLPDAMTVIGGDVAEGVSVERAIAEASERIDGATGRLLRRAARRSRTLRVGVREAFIGHGGPAETIPSPRVHGGVSLLAVAAREGDPAGDVILDLADQLERLRELERESRRQLATVTGTLLNTAAVFAPLVGGATVALATGIDATGSLSGSGLGALTDVGTMTTDPAATGSAATDPGAVTAGDQPPETDTDGGSADKVETGLTVPVLGLIVGTYVLLLAVILTALATGLERGFDPTLIAYRTGIALPTASATYLVAFVGAGALL
ncbi:type II secretion system F family protein [Halorubrum vacuolatum]